MTINKSVYYDLDKIKSYRLFLIDQAVLEFKMKFSIKNIPIDCVALAIKLNKKKDSNIKIKSTTFLPDGKLAKTIYVNCMNVYFVSVNRSQLYDAFRKRPKYPYRCSSDRMVNFTLAHEFGHIFLGHTDIPDSCKTPEILEEEDLEANEFAGRLLIPKASLQSCSFSTLSEIASEFMVSEQAILKRLTQLERQDKRFTLRLK